MVFSFAVVLQRGYVDTVTDSHQVPSAPTHPLSADLSTTTKTQQKLTRTNTSASITLPYWTSPGKPSPSTSMLRWRPASSSPMLLRV
jgi:hypothetical protein